jgi:CBS domain containing-hemolysin-like protein
MSDIKEVLSTKRNWSYLMFSTEKFFTTMRSKLTPDGDTRVPNFTISNDTSLIMAIAKMHATKSHRVWVANDAGIFGVVSMSSVMKLLVDSSLA